MTITARRTVEQPRCARCGSTAVRTARTYIGLGRTVFQSRCDDCGYTEHDIEADGV